MVDYIEEHCTNQVILVHELRKYMKEPDEYGEQNWEKWCVYLVKHKISSEYQLCIEKMISLPYSHSSLTIATALLENEETREVLLKEDFFDKCDLNKKMYI